MYSCGPWQNESRVSAVRPDVAATVADAIPRERHAGLTERLARNAFTMEARTDDELIMAARDRPDPVLREHALYQLIERQHAETLDVAMEIASEDPDAQLRVNVLWLLQSLRTARGREQGLTLMQDANPDVRDWARKLCWEMGWASSGSQSAAQTLYRMGNVFDEVLPVRIKCHLFVCLCPENDMWGHLTRSPQVMNRICGEPVICLRCSGWQRELVMVRTIRDLHPDGSPHHESLLFRGLAIRSHDRAWAFGFEALGM